MPKSPNIFKRIWASFIFLTRLPFWRLYQPPKEAYTSVVEHWPLVGWLTAAISAAALYFIAPYNILIAVLAAIVIRILVTGALHEDGLADFFDGFGGGGKDRERILSIMKDSHIGTFGVLGLICYILLLGTSLFCIASVSPEFAALTVLMADPFSKMLAAQTVMAMPYSRKEEESKARNIYRRARFPQYILLLLEGLIPLGLYIWLTEPDTTQVLILVLVPALLCTLLNLFIYKRIKGYTGDCNGAIFLLTELSIYITATFLI